MISETKAYEHAREIVSTVRDLNLDAIQSDVEALIRKHRDTAPTDVLAQIAFDAFGDGYEGYEIDFAHDWFAERFPVLAEYVR